MSELEKYGSCTLEDDNCATCGDRAVPVRVLNVEEQIACCADLTGAQATVAVDFIEDVRPGDILLVHRGAAIGQITEE